MGRTGKYIYGVINSNTEEFFDLGEITAFEDIYSLRSSPEAVTSTRTTAGCAYAVIFQDIAAIVSDSEIVDYTHMPKDTLARLLVSHQQLVEKVMARHTIIPMRLGTFASDDEDVRQILSKGYRTIIDIFERVKDSIEVDVAVTLSNFKAFLQEISEEEEIKQLKQSFLGKQGGVTVDDRMKVGLLVKRHLDKKKEMLADRIQTALGKMSQIFKAHDLMDDKMVLNTAFLIGRRGQKDFEQKVDELNNEFAEKLNFRCVGPLPPYSFYTLEVKRVRFEEIDWARKKLGISNDFITKDEIKKAHHRLALTCHPDKNPHVPSIEEKFDDMTRAYKTLLDYYRTSNQTEQGNGCCFNEEAFKKNTLVVTTVG